MSTDTTPTPKQRYPLLCHLMAGYYNQDWDLDYQDPDAVTLGFLAESEPGTASAMIDELSRLRAQLAPLNEEARQQFLYRRLGSYFIPYGPGGYVDAWLAHLQELARAAPEPER